MGERIQEVQQVLRLLKHDLLSALDYPIYQVGGESQAPSNLSLNTSVTLGCTEVVTYEDVQWLRAMRARHNLDRRAAAAEQITTHEARQRQEQTQLDELVTRVDALAMDRAPPVTQSKSQATPSNMENASSRTFAPSSNVK